MAFSSVAGDHDQRVRDDGVDDFLRVGEDQHPLLLAGIVQFVEALFGEVLAGVGKNEIAVVDAEFFTPSGIEERGIDGGHAGDVGIRFGGDVETAGAGSFDQRNAFERVAQAGAVDVNDVQRRAGDGGCPNDFFDGFDGGAGLDAAGAAHVGVDRELALGGDAEHVDDFEARGSGSVLNAHADAECAGVEFVAQALLNALDLLGSGGLVGGGSAFGQDLRNARCGPWLPSQRRAENQSACRYVAGGGAVVDERVALLVSSRNWATSGAPISISSAVVTPSKALTRWLASSWPCWCRSMKPGATTRPAAWMTRRPLSGVGGDAGDLAVADADVADGVEASFGVHDAAAFEDEIILLGETEGVESRSKAENQLAHGGSEDKR